MIRQVNKKNQLTLPPNFLKQIGVEPSGYVAVGVEGRRIILKPVRVEEDEFTQEELDALERVIKEQLRKKQYKAFDTDEEFLAHLRKLRKKK